jgi:hypothetical protein
MEINKVQYLNLKSMLDSTDKQANIVAYSILREKSFKNNSVIFLLLAKNSKRQSDSIWKTELENQEEFLNIISRGVTYQSIFDYLISTKASFDQIEFLLNDFTTELKVLLNAMGYEFVKDLELKIQTNDEQPRELSQSI